MNKWVLVTGASRGIGKETALYLASNGYNIVLHCSNDVKRLDGLKQEIEANSVQARTIAFDIRNRAQVEQILINDIETNGMYYGVVLNAGIAKDNPFPAMEEDEWDDVLRTNLDGFYNVLKPLIMPFIQQKKGRIVVMSSISGQCGNRGQVNYSASKAGLIGAAKALSQEVAKRKITVNCIAPGIIETDMTEDLPEEMVKQIPMRRMGQAKEVASLVNYLMSEDAGYITGQVIGVNGGLYL